MSSLPPAGFLLLPESGAGALASILRKLRLLALRRLLSQPPSGLPPALRGALERLQAVLPGLARRSQAAVLDALGAVDVLGPLLCLERGAVSAARVLPELAPSLLARLAHSGADALEESLLWDAPVPRLIDELAGVCADFEPAAAGLCLDRLGLEIRLGSGALLPWQPSEVPGAALRRPFHRVEAAGLCVHLSELDTHPLSALEAHPDKQGNAVDLGGRPVAEWRERLGAALELIAVALPELAAELSLSLRRIVPVGYEPERHLSASYREAPGLIYLTLHPSELTLAEAIVHETQHGKLNALSWFDPVLHNGQAEWAASPVRPDLRPLMGVLLAAHAFVPVAALHRRLLEQGHPAARTSLFQQRRLEVLAQNAEAVATVRRLGRPSALGERLLAELDALHVWSASA
jgi:HEXXH motif-containing protein